MVFPESRESTLRRGPLWSSSETPEPGEAPRSPRLRWGSEPEATVPGPTSPGTLPLEPLEEVDWRPPPTLRERLLRAVGTPIIVGIVLFLGAVIGAVVLVAVQPHSPAASRAETDAAGASRDAADAGATADAESSGAGVADDEDPAASMILVHVVGEVRAPGVVELAIGARVREAIEAAGGATEQAVLSGVNLARPVVDGEQISVPDAAAAEAAAALPAPSANGGPGLVSLNVADAAALETLPGVGPALAQRILAWRTANGAFSNVDQLLEVSGIGQQTLAGLRERVTL